MQYQTLCSRLEARYPLLWNLFRNQTLSRWGVGARQPPILFVTDSLGDEIDADATNFYHDKMESTNGSLQLGSSTGMGKNSKIIA